MTKDGKCSDCKRPFIWAGKGDYKICPQLLQRAVAHRLAAVEAREWPQLPPCSEELATIELKRKRLEEKAAKNNVTFAPKTWWFRRRSWVSPMLVDELVADGAPGSGCEITCLLPEMRRAQKFVLSPEFTAVADALSTDYTGLVKAFRSAGCHTR